ncbi:MULTISPECIES: type II toxin-antitoxin system PemK/MazF family toxin [Fusobacterium]|uniref:mRNA interferase n=1 Tax=Fusobacterium hominis TaxID=2764326 RepID=A0A7G9GYT4_9FUSO|nr:MULTISPECIES: type II toxin-antitoxin system PemK/MazF family toxin [Fusobacterium]QNM15966.1 type II toxin-antitoxin system PemK/MazF family toxin [Fusobacterium hominis]
MVRQGDIIKINFNPQAGHEQAGYRPAIVVSNNFFNEKTNLTIVCPITNTNNHFPLHIPLDNRTSTTGVILCEHIRALDLNARDFKVIEKLPEDILQNVLDIVFSEIENF